MLSSFGNEHAHGRVLVPAAQACPPFRRLLIVHIATTRGVRRHTHRPCSEGAAAVGTGMPVAQRMRVFRACKQHCFFIQYLEPRVGAGSGVIRG